MPSAVAESSVQRAPEPELDLSPLPETSLEAVGPVIEQGALASMQTAPTDEVSSASVTPAPEMPTPAEFTPAPDPSAPEEWMSPTPVHEFENEQALETITAPEVQPMVREIEPIIAPEMEPVESVASEIEPIGQGQPIPYQLPVAVMDSPVVEAPSRISVENALSWPKEVATDAVMREIETLRQPETAASEPEFP